MRDLCGKGHIGNSEIDHCVEPILQLISRFTKLEVFENHAGPTPKVSHTHLGTQVYLGSIFLLRSGCTQ